jgi:non-specific serine/threonine protein kinase
MGYIASLLARPREEVHALQLALASQLEVAGAAESGSTIEGLQAAGGLGDSGSMLDPVAKQAYRKRASELRAEIAEAESWNDFERAERARHELEFLVRELGRAVGLGGRDRRAASSTERARLSVTRAIRSAMGRIAAQLPALGAHLDESIRTGTHCSYHPDSSADPGWVL